MAGGMVHIVEHEAWSSNLNITKKKSEASLVKGR
jgi:hypothetical protein